MTKGFTIVGAAAMIAVWLCSPLAANTPITHPVFELRQAYPISCDCPPVKFAGFVGALPADECAIAGFFDIDPGSPDWRNFVTAAQQAEPYVIKNVSLEKRTPQVVQCADMFPSHVVRQTHTSNIRLRWPLMYEVPGTGIANTEENPGCCKLMLDAETLLVGSDPPAPLGIASLNVRPRVLWPTDDRMVPVYIYCEVTGEGPFRHRITSVTANEPINPPDYRGLNGDYRIFSCNKVYLRRSRSDKWRDRVYTITVTATDSRGNQATGEVEVHVPRLLLRF